MYQKYLKLNPAKSEVYQLLGTCYAKVNQPEKAV